MVNVWKYKICGIKNPLITFIHNNYDKLQGYFCPIASANYIAPFYICSDMVIFTKNIDTVFNLAVSHSPTNDEGETKMRANLSCLQ